LVLYDKIPSPEDDSIDVLYLSASVWEPATDAERLFGKGGPAETNNQYIVQSLGKLNSARNWREVRDGCQDLHALVAAHLPILPLWQVSETFAYRTEMIGVAKRPIGLYQDVQKWRIQVK
jgi:ABC-type oligopeptide transport system substrate-binding subunit